MISMRFWILLAAFSLTVTLGCQPGDPLAGAVSDHDAVAVVHKEAEAGPDRFNQSFAQAAITDEIPEGQEQPPDVTFAGKPAGPLRMAVERDWNSIVLTDRAGKPLALKATVTTDAGEFEIALRPELAPNHVRNFLALAKAGYYDGLHFDRLIHQVSDEDPKVRLDLVKFGCPLGTGERGCGHIGYFLRPEIDEAVKHEEGTVGFWRDEDANSAGCRLYITLGPAPALDGAFTVIGRVSRGIDVVKTIASGETRNPDAYPEKEIPIRPIRIQRVTVAGGH